MRQPKTRELLVTTKAAKSWDSNFEERVDELITMISYIDDERKLHEATEMLDVYRHNNPKTKARRKKSIQNHRPFEFLVFRN
ncbi:MAG: hypothetical protein JST52_10690 [Bacteroidetes bacterium]|nr:hypothetical protein [Bacteroidota bacterium]MBS1741300.1 hypothetical protein [Bacteroidota bacterium]